MEQLVELIEMLGEDYLPVQQSKLGKRVNKLFGYLRESATPTEREAAMVIGVASGSSDFRKVKHHLKLALINGVVAIEPNQSSKPLNRVEANHQVWNYVAGSRSELEPVKEFFAYGAEEFVLEPARNFDLQEPLLVAYLSFLNSITLNSMRRKEFLRVCQQIRTELDYDYKLQLAHKHYTHSTFLNINRASELEKAAYLAKAVAEIDEVDAVDRFRTWQTSLYLGLKLRFAERKYDDAIDFIESAMLQFNSNDPIQRPMVRVFQNNLLRAFLYGCRYEEGVDFGKALLEKETKVKETRYATQELTMVLALRQGDYKFAYKIYRDVVDNEVVEVVKHNFKETFLIIEAYLYLLVGFGLIDIGKEGHGVSKLKIGKFINDMAFSSKEKKRRNIHVIIIKLINHYLYRKNDDFDMSEAIRKYVQRHLNDLNTIRAKNFILALVSFCESGFSLSYAASEYNRYLSELDSYLVGENDQHPYGELVEFDALWLHITEGVRG